MKPLKNRVSLTLDEDIIEKILISNIKYDKVILIEL